MNYRTFAQSVVKDLSDLTDALTAVTIRRIVMIDLLPDDGYFHSIFGSDNQKCPPWFSVLFGLSMIIAYGTIGFVLVSIIF